MSRNTGARYEIAIDGTPRTYRDRKELATETATLLKTKNVHSEVTVRDLETASSIRCKNESGRARPLPGFL